jgi:hypothetical protein
MNQINQRDQIDQINPSRLSRSALLQEPFLVVLGILVVDFPITHNGSSGTY